MFLMCDGTSQGAVLPRGRRSCVPRIICRQVPVLGRCLSPLLDEWIGYITAGGRRFQLYRALPGWLYAPLIVPVGSMHPR